MKTRFKHLGVILLCLILVLSTAACGSSKDTENSDSEEGASSVSSTADSGDVDITLDQLEGTLFSPKGASDESEYELVSENSDYKMYINQNDLTVMVKVKSTGYKWKTNLTAAELENSSAYADTKNQYMSQLMLTYYDKDSKKNVFTSYVDALGNNSEFSPTVKCFSIDNGVRVAYKIGNNIDYFLMPDVLTEKTFNEISSKLSTDDKYQFESYYLLTKFEEIDKEQQGAVSSTYPLIKSENLYILQAVSKVQKERFVNNSLRAAGVNLQLIKDEYEKIGYNKSVPIAANFLVMIDYTLTDDGLNVNVPTDKIVYDDENFKIHSLSVLPFFGTVTDGSDGYMVVPDGSGTLFDLNVKSPNSASFPFYGPDRTQWTKDYPTNMQQATLPVFGVQNGNNSFIAYVSKGEAQGTVECHPSNDVFPYAYVSTNYEITEFETYLSNGMSTLSNMLKFAQDSYQEDINIQYSFLTGEESNYVGMAKNVRDKMFSGSEKLSDNSLKFYYETYGTILRSETLIGYAYNAKRALSTIDETKEIYDYLRSNGVKNIALRYNNWNGDKYVNEISSIAKVSGKIGSKKDFRDLSAYLESNNDTLYPNLELVLEKSTNSLSATSTHAKLMEGTLVKYSPSDNVYQKAITVSFNRMVLKSDVVLNKIDGILKKMAKLDSKAVALSTIGDTMFSDFSDKTVHREQVKNNISNILEKVSENNKIMVDVGNAYTFKYVDDIVDLPMSNSNLSFESESIPFLQIVLHGYVSYAGEALNLSDNYSMSFLKAIEYGGGVRYVLNHADPEMLKNTNYSLLFSTHYERWAQTAAEDYTKASSVLNGLQNCCITNHQKLADKVYMTTYDNGTSVIVNYGTTDYTYNSVTAAASDFAVVQG